MSDPEARLWQLMEPFLAAEGIELDDVDVRGAGGARVVRVSVDAEGGVDLDRITELSRGLSRLLDDADPLPSSYTLEVTSPGLERSLRRPAHYRKSIGREVVMTTREPVSGSTRHRGVLEAVAGEAVTLRVDQEQRHIPLDRVAQARTVFRWEKAPRPGRK